MLANKIELHEKDFHTTGNANGTTYSLIPKEIGIPGTTEQMPYIECRRTDGNEDYFYKTKIEKTKVVLHFTAGYLKGDIAALTNPERHVSVAFVIARSGHIYNLFSSAYWSYHLGNCDCGNNTLDSKRSLAIEISNIGPLKQVGNDLHTTYGDKYCSLDDTQYYTKLEEPFRGYTFFASFTDEQYQSLKTLLRYLVNRYSIPTTLINEPARYECTDQNSEHEGIVSHINFRKTDKWDIGPAFNWDIIQTI